MEFWVFIILAAIGLAIVFIVAFFWRRSGYKTAMKKVRIMSMMGMSPGQDGSGTAADPRDENLEMAAPPPYAISLQHPIIGRPSVGTTRPGGLGERETSADPVDSDTRLPSGNAVAGRTGRGDTLTTDYLFVPPPYCLEPPPYCDVIADLPRNDIIEGTRGSAMVY